MSKDLYAADIAITEAIDLSDVELRCRALVHKMVVPIIDLAKTNLDYNASKNDHINRLEISQDDFKHKIHTMGVNLNSLPKL